jgi:hypothetical protein
MIIRDQRGAASLEFFVVFIPWLAIVFFFFNLLFLLGSLMNNQAALVRGAQQVAAVGCVPQGLKQQITEAALAADNPTITIRAFTDWSGLGDEFAADGRIAEGQVVADCQTDPARRVPGGQYIYVQLEYKQFIPLLDIFTGVEDRQRVDINVRRGALVVSQSLEER